MDEIASLTPIYGGISYARIERTGIQWPCPSPDHPGTETLYEEIFARPNNLAKFIPLDHTGPGEQISDQYPLALITGRRLEHYNNGSMTGRVKGIMELLPEELLEMHPSDAHRLGIKDGEMVKVSSIRGEIQARAKVTDRSQEGTVFLAFHHREALTNILTSDQKDPITGTPEYKFCAVRVERL
jgi:predicted molibdopterin-dependent oxidoreductase YjgC